MAPQQRVILGLMTFHKNTGAGGRIANLDDFVKALDIFQERGYSELDTARIYGAGSQEAFTQEAGWKEKGFSIATKVYPLTPGIHKAKKITEEFETSLRELGTDCVDIAYLHAADRSVPFAETLEAMDKMHKAGKFKQLGLSNFTAFEVAEIVMICKYNGWVLPTIYQGLYNFFRRGIETELIPACHRYGLDVVVYSPIAAGLLSGLVKDKDALPLEGRFAAHVFNGGPRKTYFQDSTFEALQTLKNAAAEHGLSMIEVALRWLVHHSALNIKDGGGDGIVMGVSSVGHLQSNLDDLEKGPLPDALLGAIDAVWSIAKVDAGDYFQGQLKYTYDTKTALFGPDAK
ncbi:aflatoxin B1 aldehyde reductase member 3 [Thozetella sp. PMI_491]|nr:aflatoxin B1 aldehyde reductase member 3 [Thozetella sp. PMI_491]